MASLNNQSFKDNVCLSLDSSSEKQETENNSDNALRFNLIEMYSSNNLEKIKASLQEKEIYEKLKTLQFQIDQELSNMEQSYSQNSSKSSLIADLLEQEKAEVDSRSIYVGNVDYSVTALELHAHFHDCGIINRVTILCNKFDGHPKGFAYIEFVDENAVDNAMYMNNSLLRGRKIKVNLKRMNKPGISSTNRPVVPRERAMYQVNTCYEGYRHLYRPRAPYFQRKTFHPYGQSQ